MGRLGLTAVCLLGLMFPYAAPWVCATGPHREPMAGCADGPGQAAVVLTAPSAGCGIAQCPTAQTTTCTPIGTLATLHPAEGGDGATPASGYVPGALAPPTPPPKA